MAYIVHIIVYYNSKIILLYSVKIVNNKKKKFIKRQVYFHLDINRGINIIQCNYVSITLFV